MDCESRIKRFKINGIEVFDVNYRGLEEKDLIALTNYHREIVVKNKKLTSFIADGNDAVGTPAYIKAAILFSIKTKDYIYKGAFLGIDGVKKVLLDSTIKAASVDNFKTFDTREEAIEWLSEI